MLTLVPLVAILLTTTPARAEVDLDGGARRTAKAVRAALKDYTLDGRVWLGKLRGVGGGRDTLVYVPSAIDASRTIDLVVYMEGIGSFDDAAMKTRHVASMARLRGNTVYVAPDSPSSTLGDRASKNEHWQAGCGTRACPGGHAAPGDFLVFLDEVRTKLATTIGADRAALDLRVSLIGFSRGGKGVQGALRQLEASKFVAGGFDVRIADVIFADGNYHWNSLDGSWGVLASRPEAPRLTILVARGAFDATGGGDGNRKRALEFWKWAAPEAPRPSADGPVSAKRLRLVPLRGGHHAIGDAAVDYLGHAVQVVQTT